MSDDGEHSESLNFSLDGSECTIELVMELYALVGRVRSGETTLPADIARQIQQLLDNWEQQAEPDREVRTLIERIVRLKRENRELRDGKR